jgi:hypothetical protein
VAPPLNLSVPRPDCPLGHVGRVQLDGYYGRVEHFRRPRYRCVQADGTVHRFTEALARRQPTETHPHGADCEHCGRNLGRNEGPQTGRGFVFTDREIAGILRDLGDGKSFRRASVNARREAARTRHDAFGSGLVSRHGQLAMNYLTAFAPTVAEALLPKRWPPALVLDSVPFIRRGVDDEGAPVKGGVVDFALFGAYGYRAGAGSGAVWKIDVRGGYDHVEWIAFLRSLNVDAAPEWVVADGDHAIRKAVAEVWPGATFYVCEAHLLRLGDEQLAKDSIYRGHPLHDAWHEAQWSEDRLATFARLLAQTKAPNMRPWFAKRRPFFEHQLAIRQKGRPRATGALETALIGVRNSIGKRHHNLRNFPRLRLLLDLMTIHAREEDDPRTYTRLVRDALVAAGGRPPSALRGLDDPGRAGSIKAMTKLVDARRATDRAANRKLSHRFEARESVKRQQRRKAQGPRRTAELAQSDGATVTGGTE